jgi:hypothetical protein
MKNTWNVLGISLTICLLAAAGTLSSNLAFAQQDDTDVSAPPPIPPKVPGEELAPTVVITEKEGERIEEYSREGRVYMVKITPIKGPAYWYLDEDGDGQLELQQTDKGQGPVRPVYWKLKEW